MEELNNVLYQSLSRYFTVLEKTGYIKLKDVDKLILLLYIQEFLSKYQEYITEKDYEIIANIISCISSSSCLVPYIQYKQISLPMEGYVVNTFTRIDDQEAMRLIEPESEVHLVNL